MAMRVFLLFSALAVAFPFMTPERPEAPLGFDNKSNGLVDDPTHQADQEKFDEIEALSDGLGPIYNAQSCRECHQNPTSGASSQITELRVGHLGPDGRFRNPDIPINHGTEIIKGRTLVNDRAICPNAAFPDTDVQERVPTTETIRTNRIALNLLGDGFVEAIPDEALIDLARSECKSTHGRICGVAIRVPIIEAPGQSAVGRFGWKDEHASLLSFSGDAYLNEMGITNPLFPDEVTNLCNTVSEPNDTPGPDGLSDIDHFARFIRASKAPPPDLTVANTPPAKRGSELFDKIGCATCHIPTMTTAPAGTKVNGGAFTVPAALADKTFHPFSDFLLHNVGTGDGIVIAVVEHFGRMARNMPHDVQTVDFEKSRNKLRTPPLWGVRFHSRLMHDGASVTLVDAIHRHAGEASLPAHRFRELSRADQDALIAFLKSL
ncbi:MAG: hypothetical protein JOY62_07155 [Acidobacteriaceae bacterium]|nr:hypothetical protein [Acidobacteriaceae bacterium]MBV9779735.1 hypothetical protein [Acidobacteriaceae bacterium]